MQENRSCREFMEQYNSAVVNCATCVKWDRTEHRCRDIAGVVKRYEDMPAFIEYERMMRENKGVVLG